MLQSRLLGAVGIVAVVGAVLVAQAPTTPAFDVASVKPNTSGAAGLSLGFAPDGIRAVNLPPATMLWMALGVQPDQIIDTPSWASTEHFDINAKVAPGGVFNSATMFRPMLLDLLGDRFQLKMHHETRELSVYRLVRLRADRLGPKLTPAAIDACEVPTQTDAASLRTPTRRCAAGPIPGGLSVHGMGLAALVALMGPSAGRVVVDATELSGNWDLDLTFVDPVQSGGTDGLSLFTAVQEQLGLKLEPGRAPVDVVVVDHLEHPTAN
jgi:uncharacterized protein (TIGR03435 family)